MMKRKMKLWNCRQMVIFMVLILVLLISPFLPACGETSKTTIPNTSKETITTTDPNEKLPVVFVPGITGSILVSPNPSAILWPPGGQEADIVYTSLRDDFRRLSLNPATAPHESIYATDVIREYGPDPVYKDFLDFLKEEGDYIEYEVQGNPARRTTTGAFYSQKPKPSLFVFAYDWRLPIEDNAGLLSEYISVINKYYPDKKVNIVTHSMGGLVARRYIIDHPGKVNKCITIAAPFLGSAKPLYQMIYGKLSAPAYYGKEATIAGLTEYLTGGPVLDMLAFYPGLHELMASRGYYALGGPPYTIVKTLSDAISDLELPETKEVSFTELMGPGGIIEYNFPRPNANGKTPAETNRDFHAYTANGNNQDDWSNDTTGVKYYHLIGVQSTNDTPLSIREAHGYTAAQVRDYALNLYGPGDGTVPRLSAERIGNGQNYNAPGAKLYVYDDGPDELLEHTGIMRNINVLFQVLVILGEEEPVEPAGDKKMWKLDNTSALTQFGKPVYWKDTKGSYALTMTVQGNTITLKLDTLKKDEVTDTLTVVVKHDLPASLPPGEMTETHITWQMTAVGKPLYTAGAIEMTAGTSSKIQHTSLEENPSGEMAYKWKVQGIGTNTNAQKFEASINLRYTTSNNGKITFTFTYP
jgi:pimeloyl-ACP methyl ester carboxylesterase